LAVLWFGFAILMLNFRDSHPTSFQLVLDERCCTICGRVQNRMILYLALFDDDNWCHLHQSDGDQKRRRQSNKKQFSTNLRIISTAKQLVESPKLMRANVSTSLAVPIFVLCLCLYPTRSKFHCFLTVKTCIHFQHHRCCY